MYFFVLNEGENGLELGFINQNWCLMSVLYSDFVDLDCIIINKFVDELI